MVVTGPGGGMTLLPEPDGFGLSLHDGLVHEDLLQ